MIGRVRRCLLLVFVALLVAPAVPVAAGTIPVGVDAMPAARELAELVGEGDASAIYDRVHPDLRNRLPRHAFAAWLDASEALPPTAPVIGWIDPWPWTWSVTGETYAPAVLVMWVHIDAQDPASGSTFGSWVLAHTGDDWRWFPEINADEIAAVLAEPVDPPGGYRSPFDEPLHVEIDQFWQAEFYLAGIPYVPVDFQHVAGSRVETACGRVTNVIQLGIFYCIHDGTIYVHPEAQRRFDTEIGGFAWSMVIAHEWSHHIQTLLGIDIAEDGRPGLTYRELELQADCLAAILVQDMYARDAVGDDDTLDAVAAIESAGDDPTVAPDSRRSHGTAEERNAAFHAGFDGGFAACGVTLQPA